MLRGRVSSDKVMRLDRTQGLASNSALEVAPMPPRGKNERLHRIYTWDPVVRGPSGPVQAPCPIVGVVGVGFDNHRQFHICNDLPRLSWDVGASRLPFLQRLGRFDAKRAPRRSMKVATHSAAITIRAYAHNGKLPVVTGGFTSYRVTA